MKEEFQLLMTEELKIARSKHANLNSFHEGYSVILEELDELWEEIKKKSSLRDRALLQSELIQVAAMCQRFYEDLL